MSTCPSHGYYVNVNGCPDCNQPRTDAVRSRRRVETAEYGAFATRIIAGYRRRVGVAGDIGALRGLVELRTELDTAIMAAGNQLHAAGYSYAELATALGVSRNAVYERFGPGRNKGWCAECYETLTAYGVCPQCDPHLLGPVDADAPTGQLDETAPGWEWSKG